MRWRGRGGEGRWRSRWSRVGCLLNVAAAVVDVVVVVHCAIKRMCAGAGVDVERVVVWAWLLGMSDGLIGGSGLGNRCGSSIQY